MGEPRVGPSVVRIFSSLNSAAAHNVRNALEAQGVRCELRGEHRASLFGEIPMPDAMTEVWLVDRTQEALAQKILASSEPSLSSPWKCNNCGESVEGQFTECWNCQVGRSADSGER